MQVYHSKYLKYYQWWDNRAYTTIEFQKIIKGQQVTSYKNPRVVQWWK